MNFSPYQPPPDAVGSDSESQTGGIKGKTASANWFSREGSGAGGYQSGGVPEASTSRGGFGNDPEAADAGYGNYTAHSGGFGSTSTEERVNSWESRFGWRIDLMAAATYLGGPVTALLFLILETQNDYVRFHAYQSALLTTPLVLFMLLTNLLLPFPTFLRTLIVIAGVGVTLYAAFRAWKDAQEGLSRYWLPFIGPIAERWVNEE